MRLRSKNVHSLNLAMVLAVATLTPVAHGQEISASNPSTTQLDPAALAGQYEFVKEHSSFLASREKMDGVLLSDCPATLSLKFDLSERRLFSGERSPFVDIPHIDQGNMTEDASDSPNGTVTYHPTAKGEGADIKSETNGDSVKRKLFIHGFGFGYYEQSISKQGELITLKDNLIMNHSYCVYKLIQNTPVTEP